MALENPSTSDFLRWASALAGISFAEALTEGPQPAIAVVEIEELSVHDPLAAATYRASRYIVPSVWHKADLFVMTIGVATAIPWQGSALMAAVANKKGAEPKRNYTQQTLKILFALSGNRCAEPNCSEAIIASPTASSPALVVGQIAHIYAISEDGPRGKAGLTAKELNRVSNLILLCPTHHVKVDGQYATYPATVLLDWKTRHERGYAEAMSRSISDVGFAELEVAARSLLVARPHGGVASLATVPPQEKIEKNGLGPASVMLLSMGSAKSKEVGDVLVQAAQLDPDFPERLSGGFVERYRRAKGEGLSGDEIFTELYDWAGGGGTDKAREAAGLCIIAHLFIICDIFEK